MKTILFFLSLSLLPSTCLSQNNQVSVYINDGLSNNYLKQKVEANTAQLFSVINASFLSKHEDLNLNNKYATQRAIESLRDFWDNCPFYCDTDIINEPILYQSKTMQMRNIPIVFGTDERIYVLVEYSNDGKIDNLRIAMEMDQYKKVLESKGKVDQDRREVIGNFIENLRTAYIKKDLDVIEKLYSDKALIITGQVIQQLDQPIDYMKNSFTETQVKYQVLTKQQYINKLTDIFNEVDYVRLDFTLVDVARHRKFPDYYGVQLNQHWSTSNYEDNGILFLFIQFKEDDNPLIWVRTWQNADTTPERDVFGLHNFEITQDEILK